MEGCRDGWSRGFVFFGPETGKPSDALRKRPRPWEKTQSVQLVITVLYYVYMLRRGLIDEIVVKVPLPHLPSPADCLAS